MWEKICIWKQKEIWEVYFKSNTFSLCLQDSVYKILLLLPSENRRIWSLYLCWLDIIFVLTQFHICFRSDRSFVVALVSIVWEVGANARPQTYVSIVYRSSRYDKNINIIWRRFDFKWKTIMAMAPFFQQPGYVSQCIFAKGRSVLSENWKWRYGYEG